MNNMYAEFDKIYDSKKLAEDIRELENNGGSNDFKPLPEGQYQAYPKLMEIGENSKTKAPQCNIRFEIEDGEYKGRLIFASFNLTNTYSVHRCNEFLRSLSTGLDVNFEHFGQYAQLLADMLSTINKREMDYDVAYVKNEKGYFETSIVGVYAND